MSEACRARRRGARRGGLVAVGLVVRQGLVVALGGVALIAGPALWCLGLLLRYLPADSDLLAPDRWADLRDRPFAAPMELAMYEAGPGLAPADSGPTR